MATPRLSVKTNKLLNDLIVHRNLIDDLLIDDLLEELFHEKDLVAVNHLIAQSETVTKHTKNLFFTYSQLSKLFKEESQYWPLHFCSQVEINLLFARMRLEEIIDFSRQMEFLNNAQLSIPYQELNHFAQLILDYFSLQDELKEFRNELSTLSETIQNFIEQKDLRSALSRVNSRLGINFNVQKANLNQHRVALRNLAFAPILESQPRNTSTQDEEKEFENNIDLFGLFGTRNTSINRLSSSEAPTPNNTPTSFP